MKKRMISLAFPLILILHVGLKFAYQEYFQFAEKEERPMVLPVEEVQQEVAPLFPEEHPEDSHSYVSWKQD